MKIKKYLLHPFTKIGKGAKKAGRSIVRVPRSVGRLPAQTYQAANDAVEHAIERTVRRVQNDVEARMRVIAADAKTQMLNEVQRVQPHIEARVRVIAADVKAQVLNEIQQRQTGIMLIAGAVACVALCGITLCFGIVYTCVALFNLPIWAGFIIVSVMFAIVSAVLLMFGRKQLNNIGP